VDADPRRRLGRELARPANVNAAIGSAIVAAFCTLLDTIADASVHITRIDRVVAPRQPMEARYQDAYQRFCEALRRRGYLQERQGDLV